MSRPGSGIEPTSQEWNPQTFELTLQPLRTPARASAATFAVLAFGVFPELSFPASAFLLPVMPFPPFFAWPGHSCSQSPLNGHSSKTPSLTPWTRLSLPSAPQHPQLLPHCTPPFAIARCVYIIVRTLRQLWPRARTRESDHLRLQRECSWHEPCGRAQGRHLCFTLLSCTYAQRCCESGVGLRDEALRTMHGPSWEPLHLPAVTVSAEMQALRGREGTCKAWLGEGARAPRPRELEGS